MFFPALLWRAAPEVEQALVKTGTPREIFRIAELPEARTRYLLENSPAASAQSGDGRGSRASPAAKTASPDQR